MKNAVLALVALAFGIAAGSWMVRFPAIHRWAGRVFQRGDLIALIGNRGIFEGDVNARAQQRQYCSGRAGEPVEPAQKMAVRDELIATEALRTSSTKSGDCDVSGDLANLQHQFGDDGQFKAALRRSGVSQSQLRRLLAETICGERSIESQMAPRLVVSDPELQSYFEQHQTEFLQPLRIRARHIFLAAPDGSAAEVTAAKEGAMLDIAARLGAGEDFAHLAATVSEDEATKNNAGDLNFFAADRVPAEFFEAAAQLQPNGPLRFLHSHLGFHALQVTETHPPQPLALTETKPEVTRLVEAEKRRAAVAALKSGLAHSTQFVVQ